MGGMSKPKQKIFVKKDPKNLNFGHENGSNLSLKRPNFSFFAA
jgi:hypothetical protein